MAAPNLVIYESTDTSVITTLSFTGVSPGTPTAAQEFHAWNNKGGAGAETVKSFKLIALARNQGDTNFVGSGLEVLDTHAIEVRSIGVQGSAVDVASGWVPLGTGRSMAIQQLPNDSAIEFEARINLPASADPTVVEISFRFLSVQTTAVGGYEALGNGILLGIGDGQMHGICESEGVEENGTPDDDVIIKDVSWVHYGIPYRLLDYNETISANDGDSAALASGESYYCALTLGAGTVTQTKGSKDTDPLTDDDKPALPAGEPLLAWVVRSFDNVINTADISESEAVTTPDFFGFSSSSLTATIGAGQALVNGSLIQRDFTQDLVLAASSISTIYLLEDGSLSTGRGSSDRGMPLWYVVTDGSSVTSYVDLRNFFDHLCAFAIFSFLGTPAATDWLTWKNPFNHQLYIRPFPNAIRMQLHQEPTSLGHSSGNWIVDIEKQGLVDSGWTTIFTSQGSDDQRPTIAYNAGTVKNDGGARPEVLVVNPGETLRCQVDAIPSGGTDVDAITVAIPLEVSR